MARWDTVYSVILFTGNKQLSISTLTTDFYSIKNGEATFLSLLNRIGEYF